jgi:hypothetical protein
LVAQASRLCGLSGGRDARPTEAFRGKQEFGKTALRDSRLVPKLYLGTKMVAKLSLADKGAFPSSAWEREENRSIMGSLIYPLSPDGGEG